MQNIHIEVYHNNVMKKPFLHLPVLVSWSDHFKWKWRVMFRQNFFFYKKSKKQLSQPFLTANKTENIVLVKFHAIRFYDLTYTSQWCNSQL